MRFDDIVGKVLDDPGIQHLTKVANCKYGTSSDYIYEKSSRFGYPEGIVAEAPEAHRKFVLRIFVLDNRRGPPLLVQEFGLPEKVNPDFVFTLESLHKFGDGSPEGYILGGKVGDPFFQQDCLQPPFIYKDTSLPGAYDQF